MRIESPDTCGRLSTELLELLYYGELPSSRAASVREHLDGCKDCRNRWEALRTWLDKVRSLSPEPSEETLHRCRAEFSRRLLKESVGRGKVRPGASSPWWRTPWAAAAGVVLFLLGFAAGWVVAPTAEGSAGPGYLLDHPEFYTTTAHISYDADRDVLSLEVVAARRLQITGSPQDPEKARLLARSVLAGRNPAVRRQAVELLGELSPNVQEIEPALIAALTTDPNAAVRTRSLEVLLRRRVTPALCQALIDVLLNDPNLALRLRALEALSELLEKEPAMLRPSEVTRLLQVAQNSESTLLRRRTNALLQEFEK